MGDVKVFIVSTGVYEDYEIKRVFSTRAKAEAWVGPLLMPEENDGYSGYRIEEHDVDDEGDPPQARLWCGIEVATGKVEILPTEVADGRHFEEAELLGSWRSLPGPCLVVAFGHDDREMAKKDAAMLRDALVKKHDPSLGGIILPDGTVTGATWFDLAEAVDQGTRDELREMHGDVEFCCMHIVASDGNVEDDHIEWCLREGRMPEPDGPPRGPGRPACDTCRAYGELLLGVPLSFRALVR